MQNLKRKILTIGIMLLSLIFVNDIFVSQAFAASKEEYAQNIAHTMGELVDFLLKMNGGTMVQTADIGPKVKNSFVTVLQQRFSEEELKQMDEVHQKIGGQNLKQMTQVILNASNKIMNNGSKLEDVELKISKTYDDLLEKKIAEEKIGERLRQSYIGEHARDNNTSNLSKDAENYTIIAKKHLKKAVSDNFTEEQYAAFYHFESSDLGKRFQDAFQESIIKVLSQ